MPSKAFFFGSNLRFGGHQSTVTIVFTRWPRENSLPVSWALGITCWHFILINKIKNTVVILNYSCKSSPFIQWWGNLLCQSEWENHGKQLIGMHENSGFNRGKNPWRVHVSGNHCNMSTEFHDYLLKLRKNSASHHLPVI